MASSYNCANCKEAIPPEWLKKADPEYLCPFCGVELDRQQFDSARWQEQTKPFLIFFIVFSAIAIAIVLPTTQRTTLALVLGPVIGAASAVLGCYLLRHRPL